MSAPLIVIDAQDCFIFRNESLPGYGQTIDAIKREILSAINRNDYIIFVEFCPWARRQALFGKIPSKDKPTLSELTDLVKFYSKKIFVYKSTCDGGEEIISALEYYQVYSLYFRVCGAYTDACVLETVQTLSYCLPKVTIKIIDDATTSIGKCYNSQLSGLSKMQKLSNIVVV